MSIQTYPQDHLLFGYKALRYPHYADVEAGEIRKQDKQEELILRDMNQGLTLSKGVEKDNDSQSPHTVADSKSAEKEHDRLRYSI